MRKTKQMMLKIVSSIVILITMVCFVMAPVNQVRADQHINLSLVSNSLTVDQGGIVTISVVADNLPYITAFGPISVTYNADVAEYLSMEMGGDVSGFVYSTTQDEGKITVSATDQMASVGNEETGEEMSAFYSDASVVLFSISVRLLPVQSSNMSFSIESAGDFKDVYGNKVSVSKGDGLTVGIISDVSSDATINSLRMGSETFTPEFSPEITDYSLTVERFVTELPVNVVPSNLWAAVIIDGNQNLQIGENIITIDVTAQDGISHMQYVIHVTRRESYVPENASLIDSEGKTYTFVDIPANYELPVGFNQASRQIEGYSVPVFMKDGIESYLVYLFDGESDSQFYFYNPNLKTITKYSKNNSVIRSSGIYTVVTPGDDVTMPKKLKEASFTDEGIELNGYVDQDNNFICYIEDESGNRGFYVYDPELKEFYPYVPVNHIAEDVYSFLFKMFLVIAIIEAILIVVIIYIMRKIIIDRTTPRPKRV